MSNLVEFKSDVGMDSCHIWLFSINMSNWLEAYPRAFKSNLAQIEADALNWLPTQTGSKTKIEVIEAEQKKKRESNFIEDEISLPSLEPGST